MCFSFSVICTYCTSDAVAEGSKKSSCMIRKPALSITKQEYDLVSLHFGYTSVSNLYLMRYKYNEVHYEDTCYEILLGNVWDSVYFIRETPCSLCCVLASPTVLHLKNFAKSFQVCLFAIHGGLFPAWLRALFKVYVKFWDFFCLTILMFCSFFHVIAGISLRRNFSWLR